MVGARQTTFDSAKHVQQSSSAIFDTLASQHRDQATIVQLVAAQAENGFHCDDYQHWKSNSLPASYTTPPRNPIQMLRTGSNDCETTTTQRLRFMGASYQLRSLRDLNSDYYQLNQFKPMDPYPLSLAATCSAILARLSLHFWRRRAPKVSLPWLEVFDESCPYIQRFGRFVSTAPVVSNSNDK
ncbi:hypothetical protein DHEL01_v201174 [Diaporthe helianthi]|uniref:Uncharacterized protein n=1 Tax=Diaporthe helianthi TaxID=158607 RepID=A0A2P5ID65_DIAHE|nr:hypothetical protein DHEL01_v201174 [Diaporthe helianthi]